LDHPIVGDNQEELQAHRPSSIYNAL